MWVETRNKPKRVLYILESITGKEAQGSQFTPLVSCINFLVTIKHLNDSNHCSQRQKATCVSLSVG